MDKFENKTCQNCKQNFTIESEDFIFYDKIKVPFFVNAPVKNQASEVV